jgi:hypothetical protein
MSWTSLVRLTVALTGLASAGCFPECIGGGTDRKHPEMVCQNLKTFTITDGPDPPRSLASHGPTNFATPDLTLRTAEGTPGWITVRLLSRPGSFPATLKLPSPAVDVISNPNARQPPVAVVGGEIVISAWHDQDLDATYVLELVPLARDGAPVTINGRVFAECHIEDRC